MTFHLLVALIIVCLSAGMSAAKDKPSPRAAPEYFKVFSEDGSESLTAVCHPYNTTHQKTVTAEVTCRFTNVRFQIPPVSRFPTSMEDAIKNDPAFAKEYRKDPVKAKAEWDNTMNRVDTDFCSSTGTDKLGARINGLDLNSRRRHLLGEILEACSNKKTFSQIVNAFSEIERSTCELWVDHFSLVFRKMDDRKWFYSQEQPSYTGTLKIYELTAEPEHDLWTLTETRMLIGQKEAVKSQPVAERKTWSWQSWDSYEMPQQCRFISHRFVQYE